MNPYLQQVTPKLKIQEKNRKVDLNLFPEKGGLQSKFDRKPDKPKGRFYVISKLENCVSILQIARINIEKINEQLLEMGNFLEKEVRYHPVSNIPVSVINNYLSKRVSTIKMISEAASFQGKALLNGNSGVKVLTKGKGLRFVKGSPHVVSSDETGYEIKVTELPDYSSLMGAQPVTEELLNQETLIIITDRDNQLRYYLQEDETIDSLIQNLQHSMNEKRMNISVFKTKNKYLFFKHNQLGANRIFSGSSQNTQLISRYPGKTVISNDGKNIAGEIGNEPANGEGGYLTGSKSNKKARGLTLYYDGPVKDENRIAGHILVKQNGMVVPLDLEERKAEILSLPALTPEMLGTGIPNNSGFLSLKSIRVQSSKERQDALLLIHRSIKELNALNKDLIIKENYYVNLAIEMLRLTMKPKTAGTEILSLSKEKAGEMAEQLKGMLSPQLMVESRA